MNRFVMFSLKVVLTLGTLAAALVFAVPKTSAAPQTPEAVDFSARGPSVGVDFNDNQFVFWRGTNNQLEEAVYNADQGTFNGPNDLQKVTTTMESEPSVAVADFGGYGTDRFGAQFVFWKGPSNELWYAYWIGGTWQGAFEASSVANVASTPSAVFNNVRGKWGPGNSEITVFWQGTDGFLWYIRMTDPTGAQTFTAAHQATYNGQSLGTLGSAPGASNSSPGGVESGTGFNGHGIVTWKGATNSNLWYVPYEIDPNTGNLTIESVAQGVSKWDDVNGATSATEEYAFSAGTNIQNWELAWQDNNQDLEYIKATDLTSYASPSQVPGASDLGSAPSIGYWGGISPNTYHYDYIFWKGLDSYLHEAYYNGAQDAAGDPNFWHVYSYPQFGLL